jgi:hypothetical protein
MLKSFLYVVPDTVVKKARIRRSVQAWKSSVPGLIVQRSLDPEQKWFHITHEPSGCILKVFVQDVQFGLDIIAAIAKVPIKWTGTAEDVYRSVANLSRKHALQFYKLTGLGIDKDHRRANLARARQHPLVVKQWQRQKNR